MAKIKGITVQLWNRVQTGEDDFGRPIYAEVAEDVDNVLIGEPSTDGYDSATETLNTTGKILAYTLAIPKGDTHVWADRKITFWGETFRTIGEPTQGIEDNIPLDWNKKVKVERYG